MQMTMRALVAAVSAAGVIACGMATNVVAAPTKALPSGRDGWKLVWSDEFDASGQPDPAKWDYEVGYVRNHELQYYTRDRRANARVEDGCLIIEGRKEKYDIPGSPGSRRQADYTAASLITKGKASWTYGRVEVRAKLPQGQGVWPAIWMLGTNMSHVGWPACGEIDIMEFVGHTPDKVHGTMHYRLRGRHASKGGRLTTARPFDDFHVYAIEWSAKTVDFYFDEQKYFTFNVADADDNGQNPFRKPQYLLLNLALGGSWGGKMDDGILPQKYLIDYVRVYQAR